MRRLLLAAVAALLLAVPAAHAADQLPPFATAGFQPHKVKETSLPYAWAWSIALPDGSSTAPDGTWQQKDANGHISVHPEGAALYGLEMLNSWRLTHKPVYWSRALANARYLIRNRVASRGAWYYPYTASFDLHGNPRDVERAPWYSAMAQGQALSLFARLHQYAPDDPTWVVASRATFQTFVLNRRPRMPWTVWVDDKGYLWLEEYPKDDVFGPMKVLNGHLFAIYGVYDYYRTFLDPRALPIFDGAATTVAHYMPRFRNPGYISYYCLTRHAIASHYHTVHEQELRELSVLTDSPVFSNWSNVLTTDYP